MPVTRHNTPPSHRADRTAGPPGAMRLWAVVPAFNEESRIAAVVRGLAGAVAGVVVVDDGSEDGTADEATRAGAEVVRQDANGGKGAGDSRGTGRCTRARVYARTLRRRRWPASTRRCTGAGGGGHETASASSSASGSSRASGCLAPATTPMSIGSRALSWFIGTEVRDTQSGFRIVRADWLRGTSADCYGVRDRDRDAHPARAPRSVRSSVFRSRPVYTDAPSKLRPLRDTTRTCFLAVKYRFLSRA